MKWEGMLLLIVFHSFIPSRAPSGSRARSVARIDLCEKLGSPIGSDVGDCGSYLWELGRIFAAVPSSLGCDLCPSYPVGRVSRTLAMCSPEEAALLRLEEIFSNTLTQTIRSILQPLLLAGECRPRWGRGEHRRAPKDLTSPL